ncbi:MAG: hypothetical protein ACD_77C00376G0002 [uncultured bacterium]|nr:MAG: hypothetical protein ACD_77C00376G0002 [uncultured bacterium]HBY00934.1 hypothetical protein [Rikenellaceae bacterium]
MKSKIAKLVVALCLAGFVPSSFVCAQEKSDTSATVSKESQLKYKGQLITWVNFSSGSASPWLVGARYLPQLEFETIPKTTKQSAGAFSGLRFGFEVAANIYGSGSFDRSGNSQWSANAKLYRGWAKIATDKAEIRVGLQKINFGSAMMLRPLMWFDKIDPRDPFQLTDGVWGALGRYYFENNANIWIWGLYGNDGQRPWDIGTTASKSIEFGGRVQLPLASGEMGFTFHRRIAGPPIFMSTMNRTPENRFGFDIKLDYVIGFWAEAAWINKRIYTGNLTNQEMITLGADYTFGIGNGLNVTAEHMLLSNDLKPFEFANRINLTAFSAGYPIGLFDSINYMFYYDWKNKGVYNFLRWKHTFGVGELYVMGFVNPETSVLPGSGGTGMQMAGKGFQIMFVMNHQTK